MAACCRPENIARSLSSTYCTVLTIINYRSFIYHHVLFFVVITMIIILITVIIVNIIIIINIIIIRMIIFLVIIITIIIIIIIILWIIVIWSSILFSNIMTMTWCSQIKFHRQLDKTKFLLCLLIFIVQMTYDVLNVLRYSCFYH